MSMLGSTGPNFYEGQEYRTNQEYQRNLSEKILAFINLSQWCNTIIQSGLTNERIYNFEKNLFHLPLNNLETKLEFNDPERIQNFLNDLIQLIDISIENISDYSQAKLEQFLRGNEYRTQPTQPVNTIKIIQNFWIFIKNLDSDSRSLLVFLLINNLKKKVFHNTLNRNTIANCLTKLLVEIYSPSDFNETQIQQLQAYLHNSSITNSNILNKANQEHEIYWETHDSSTFKILNTTGLETADLRITQIRGNLTDKDIINAINQKCKHLDCNYHDSDSIENSYNEGTQPTTKPRVLLGIDGSLITQFPNPKPDQKIKTITAVNESLIVNIDHHDTGSFKKDSSVLITHKILWSGYRMIFKKLIFDKLKDFQHLIQFDKSFFSIETNYLEFEDILKILTDPLEIIINMPDPDTVLEIAEIILLRWVYIYGMKYYEDSPSLDFKEYILSNLSKELIDCLPESKYQSLITETILNIISQVIETNSKNANSPIIVLDICAEIIDRLTPVFECISEIDKCSGAVIPELFKNKGVYFEDYNQATYDMITRVGYSESLNSRVPIEKEPNQSRTEFALIEKKSFELLDWTILISVYFDEIHRGLQPQMSSYFTQNDHNINNNLLMEGLWLALTKCLAMTTINYQINLTKFDRWLNINGFGPLPKYNTNLSFTDLSITNKQGQKLPVVFYDHTNQKNVNPGLARTILSNHFTNESLLLVVAYMGKTSDGTLGENNYTVYTSPESTDKNSYSDTDIVKKFTIFASKIASYVCGIDHYHIKNFFGPGEGVRGCRNCGYPLGPEIMKEVLEWFLKIEFGIYVEPNEFYSWILNLRNRAIVT